MSSEESALVIPSWWKGRSLTEALCKNGHWYFIEIDGVKQGFGGFCPSCVKPVCKRDGKEREKK